MRFMKALQRGVRAARADFQKRQELRPRVTSREELLVALRRKQSLLATVAVGIATYLVPLLLLIQLFSAPAHEMTIRDLTLFIAATWAMMFKMQDRSEYLALKLEAATEFLLSEARYAPATPGQNPTA